MSVTFSLEASLTGPHKIVCACGEWSDEQVYDSYDAARLVNQARQYATGCDDLYCSQGYVESVDASLDVQMSNMNAVQILDVLGIQVGEEFSDRCTGQIDGADLMGRVLIAQAINPADKGSDTLHDGNIIYCGRAEGYTEGKLSSLASLADKAVRENLTIQWG